MKQRRKPSVGSEEEEEEEEEEEDEEDSAPSLNRGGGTRMDPEV